MKHRLKISAVPITTTAGIATGGATRIASGASTGTTMIEIAGARG